MNPQHICSSCRSVCPAKRVPGLQLLRRLIWVVAHWTLSSCTVTLQVGSPVASPLYRKSPQISRPVVMRDILEMTAAKANCMIIICIYIYIHIDKDIMCILALLESSLGCHVLACMFFPAARVFEDVLQILHNFNYLNTVTRLQSKSCLIRSVLWCGKIIWQVLSPQRGVIPRFLRKQASPLKFQFQQTASVLSSSWVFHSQ